MKQVILFIFLLALLSACGGKSKTASVIEAEEAIPLRYAENLSLSATEDYTIARLRNPWDTTRILHTYVLVDKEKSLPADLPEGTLVRTPLSKAVVYSSVHCGLLNQIGALKSIGGVCDLKYIKLQEVQDGCRTGSIADVGNGMNPDIEKIIDLHPDAIMLSPFEEQWRIRTGGETQHPHYRMCGLHGNFGIGTCRMDAFLWSPIWSSTKSGQLVCRGGKNYNELKALVAPLSSAPSVISELKNGSGLVCSGR